MDYNDPRYLQYNPGNRNFDHFDTWDERNGHYSQTSRAREERHARGDSYTVHWQVPRNSGPAHRPPPFLPPLQPLIQHTPPVPANHPLPRVTNRPPPPSPAHRPPVIQSTPPASDRHPPLMQSPPPVPIHRPSLIQRTPPLIPHCPPPNPHHPPPNPPHHPPPNPPCHLPPNPPHRPPPNPPHHPPPKPPHCPPPNPPHRPPPNPPHRPPPNPPHCSPPNPPHRPPPNPPHCPSLIQSTPPTPAHRQPPHLPTPSTLPPIMSTLPPSAPKHCSPLPAEFRNSRPPLSYGKPKTNAESSLHRRQGHTAAPQYNSTHLSQNSQIHPPQCSATPLSQQGHSHSKYSNSSTHTQNKSTPSRAQGRNTASLHAPLTKFSNGTARNAHSIRGRGGSKGANTRLPSTTPHQPGAEKVMIDLVAPPPPPLPQTNGKVSLLQEHNPSPINLSKKTPRQDHPSSTVIHAGSPLTPPPTPPIITLPTHTPSIRAAGDGPPRRVEGLASTLQESLTVKTKEKTVLSHQTNPAKPLAKTQDDDDVLVIASFVNKVPHKKRKLRQGEPQCDPKTGITRQEKSRKRKSVITGKLPRDKEDPGSQEERDKLKKRALNPETRRTHTDSVTTIAGDVQDKKQQQSDGELTPKMKRIVLREQLAEKKLKLSLVYKELLCQKLPSMIKRQFLEQLSKRDTMQDRETKEEETQKDKAKEKEDNVSALEKEKKDVKRKAEDTRRDKERKKAKTKERKEVVCATDSPEEPKEKDRKKRPEDIQKGKEKAKEREEIAAPSVVSSEEPKERKNRDRRREIGGVQRDRAKTREGEKGEISAVPPSLGALPTKRSLCPQESTAMHKKPCLENVVARKERNAKETKDKEGKRKEDRKAQNREKMERRRLEKKKKKKRRRRMKRNKMRREKKGEGEEELKKKEMESKEEEEEKESKEVEVKTKEKSKSEDNKKEEEEKKMKETDRKKKNEDQQERRSRCKEEEKEEKEEEDEEKNQEEAKTIDVKRREEEETEEEEKNQEEAKKIDEKRREEETEEKRRNSKNKIEERRTEIKEKEENEKQNGSREEKEGENEIANCSENEVEEEEKEGEVGKETATRFHKMPDDIPDDEMELYVDKLIAELGLTLPKTCNRTQSDLGGEGACEGNDRDFYTEEEEVKCSGAEGCECSECNPPFKISDCFTLTQDSFLNLSNEVGCEDVTYACGDDGSASSAMDSQVSPTAEEGEEEGGGGDGGCNNEQIESSTSTLTTTITPSPPFCYTCKQSIKNGHRQEDIRGHLYFGMVSCEMCDTDMYKCHAFRAIRNLDSASQTCGKSPTGHHVFSKWVGDPYTYLTSNVCGDFLMYQESDPNTRQINTRDMHMAVVRYVRSLQALRGEYPWRPAIEMCWRAIEKAGVLVESGDGTGGGGVVLEGTEMVNKRNKIKDNSRSSDFELTGTAKKGKDRRKKRKETKEVCRTGLTETGKETRGGEEEAIANQNTNPEEEDQDQRTVNKVILALRQEYPPPEEPTEITTPDDKRFLVVRYPSQECPDECPDCYVPACPAHCTYTLANGLITYVCPGCHLIIYIIADQNQDVVFQGHVGVGGGKPCPKSRKQSQKMSLIGCTTH